MMFRVSGGGQWEEKCLAYHQSEFLHSYCTRATVHDGNHGSALKIFLLLPEVLKHLIKLHGAIFPIPRV